MVNYSIIICAFLLAFAPWCIQGHSSSKDAACTCDMLVVMDVSRSIGYDNFYDRIVPFIKRLIKSDKIDIGADGFEMALIAFSGPKNTEIKFNFPRDGVQNRKELLQYFKNKKLFDSLNPRLKETGQPEGYTYTGIALRMAYQKIFRYQSPSNARTKVADVVLLITDGRPQGPDADTTTKQRNMAKYYAKKLKDNRVRVIGLAVNTNGRKDDKFRDFTRDLASPKNFFSVDVKQMDRIISPLLDKSCGIKPGHCQCSDVKRKPVYVSHGEMAEVSWPDPQFTCGNEAITEGIKHNAAYTSPHKFPVGFHRITYTLKYGKYEASCDVEIEVKERCRCSDVTVKPVYISSGGTAVVSWKPPSFMCGSKKESSDKIKATPNHSIPHRFGKGRHKITYKLKYGEGLEVSCDVDIEVKAIPCAGKEYDSTRYVCCCGNVHRRKPNHVCCGATYIDSRTKKCCKYYNVVSKNENCPGE